MSTPQELKELYVGLQAETIVTLFDEVLKSKDFISKYGELKDFEKRNIQNHYKDIAKEVLEEEFDSQNIRNEADFNIFIENLDEEKHEKQRKLKIIEEAGNYL